MRAGFISRPSERALVCAALSALVFFSRAWLIRDWGSPLPFWDQWDAEAVSLYAPWLNGTLHWSDLFKAHNEHRIFLTRVADLVLFSASGGWNPWAQMLLNAALHAATSFGLAALFWPALPRRSRGFFVIGVAMLFTATCGWQNALYGFQSQVYFANLLAVGAIAGLCTGAPLGSRWWPGLAMAALAFLSNGGGILAAVAAFPVCLAFGWGAPRTTRTWIALGLIATVTVLAILPASGAPQHAAFHARNVSEFCAVLAHCLAWPWINRGLACVVLQMPLVWLTLIRWRRQQPLDTAERCALALGVFALLQAAAIAYTRGAVLPESRPLSRYQDPLLLGAVGQLFAVLRLSGKGNNGRIVGMVWIGAMIGGLIGLTEVNFTLHLPFKRAQDAANLAIVRDYAVTHDPAAFTRDPNFSGPHPDPRIVQHAIDDPILRSTLPAEILVPEAGGNSSRPWIIRHSPALTAASGLLLLGALVSLFRRKIKWA